MEISLLLGQWRHESLGRTEILDLGPGKLVSTVSGQGVERDAERLEKPVLDIFALPGGGLRVLTGPDPRLMNPYEKIDVFELDARVMLARMDGHQFRAPEHARAHPPSDRALAKFHLREALLPGLAPAPRLSRPELLALLEALRARAGQAYARQRQRQGARVWLFDDLLRLQALDGGQNPFAAARAFYNCLAENADYPGVGEALLSVKNAIG